MTSAAITGGITGVASATPTVDAGAYADGDALSAIMTFAIATNQASGAITRIVVRSITTVTVDSFLHLFNEAVSGSSTITKNSAVSIHADDRAKLFESVYIAADDWVNCGAAGFRAVKQVWLPFAMANGNPGNIYGVLELDAAHTPGSTSDFIFWLGAELNG